MRLLAPRLLQERKGRRVTTGTVLYDGHCRFCVGSKKRLERVVGARLEWASFREPEVAARFPALSPDALEQSLHLVTATGRVYAGAEAVVRVLLHQPLFFWARLYYVPGLRQLVDAAYRWVARSRFKWFGATCADGQCKV